MNKILLLTIIGVIAFIVIVGILTYPVNAQVQQEEKRDTVDLGDVRQFLELGEEKYREECNKDIRDNKIIDDTMNDILDYMPDSLREDICENKINEIKNQTLGSILKDDEK